MAQISRAYKFEVPMFIRILHRNYNQQRREYTYYEVLRISPNATQKEIKDAYITLSKEMHPDRGNKGSHAAFLKINEAYTILSKAQSRHYYDINLKSNNGCHINNTFYYPNNAAKQWEQYGIYNHGRTRAATADDRKKAIRICFLTILIGILLQLYRIKRWSELNRRFALEKSGRLQTEYEDLIEQNKNKTLEEHMQQYEEWSKKHNF